jgi:O-succinylbenzoic acid--CoA ligase
MDWDWLRRQATLAPLLPYVETPETMLTFGEADRQVDRVARRLQTLGVAHGARVAVLLDGGLPWVLLVWALIRLRATLVPINARLAEAERAAILADAEPALLITGVEGSPAWNGPTLVVEQKDGGDLFGAGGLERPPRPQPGDIQSIIYTSGTTGRSKGALIRLEQHWWNLVGSQLRLGHAPDDVWLLTMPLYHVGGQAILFRAAVGGLKVVLRSRFDAGGTARLLQAGEVTLASLVPTMLRRVLDASRGPFSPRLRAVLIGGAACPGALAEEARDRGIPVVLTYGMTEGASQLVTQAPGEPSPDGGTGTPLWAVEMRIGDPDGDGAGEIQVRGPQITAGYWRQEVATRNAFTEDGWFRTGDLGRIDPNGVLVVLDRRQDLIVSGGENVYPAEVEAVLMQHPAVREAGVAAMPDPEWGQVPGAWVVAVTPLTAEELDAFCRARLAAYKVPRRWTFVGALPHTANGKLVRRALLGLESESRA